MTSLYRSPLDTENVRAEKVRDRAGKLARCQLRSRKLPNSGSNKRR